MSRPRVPIEQRFLGLLPAKRPTSGCLLWVGATDTRGIPVLRSGGRGGRNVPAKRIAFEVFVRPLADDEEVTQTCGNRLCMRGEHLFAGDHAAVVAMDREVNGHYAVSGERHVFAKLSTNDVERIRHLAERGATPAQLSRVSGISHEHIRNIVAGKARVRG